MHPAHRARVLMRVMGESPGLTRHRIAPAAAPHVRRPITENQSAHRGATGILEAPVAAAAGGGVIYLGGACGGEKGRPPPRKGSTGKTPARRARQTPRRL